MTMHARPARPHATDRERGSISLWAVLAAFCMIIIVGIAVDFGGQAVAEQHARSIAFEAARAGGQNVDLNQLIRGGQAHADPGSAAAAANAYLAAAGVTGSATADQNTVTVTVIGHYDCVFLNIIGITSLPVSGTATADILRVYRGEER